MDWSEEEVDAAVRDYLDMLSFELQGDDYIKAAHNRHLRESLNGRSRRAVELKHQNISAVLLEMDLPYIDGYKPLGNYQRILKDIVLRHIRGRPEILYNLERQIAKEPESPPAFSTADALVDAPEINRHEREDGDDEFKRIAKRWNFPEREARNKKLGKLGESFVVEFEKARLCRLGMEELARRVEWVSETQGDGLGYDIESFDDTGTPRIIEVKTTNCGRSFPFLVTANEVEVSRAREREFCLYRVFQFSRQPRLFMLPGAIDASCLLEARTFRASFGRRVA